MGNFQLPRAAAYDDNGAPLSGGLLYTYESGTSTPLACYSDSGLSTPHTNPVEADAAGRFPEIYLDPDSSYSIRLADANDATVYTADNVTALESSTGGGGGGVTTAIATTPFQHGAVGDGVADDYEAIREALAAATSVVDLCGATFKCDSQLVVPGGITLRNGTLDFSSCPDDSLIKISCAIGTPIALTSAVSSGDTSFTVASAASFSVGQRCFVYSSSDEWKVGGAKHGEIVRLSDVNNGTNTITVNSRMALEYSSLTTNIAAIDGADGDGAALENLTILAGYATTQSAVEIGYCADVVVKDCVFHDAYSAAVWAHTCTACVIDSCSAYDCTGLAFEFSDSSLDCEVINCSVSGCDYGVVVGDGTYGPCIGVSIDGCKVIGAVSAGVRLLVGAYLCRAHGCSLSGAGASTYGVLSNGVACSIDGNSIRNCGGVGVWCGPTFNGSVTTGTDPTSKSIEASGSVSGNKITLCGSAGVTLTSTVGMGSVSSWLISENVITGCGLYGVGLNLANGASGITISGNSISDTSSHGINVDLPTAGATVSDLLIVDNHITLSGGSVKGVSITPQEGTTLQNVAVESNIISTEYSCIELVANNVGTDPISVDCVRICCNTLSTSADTTESGVYVYADTDAQIDRIIISKNSIHCGGTGSDVSGVNILAQSNSGVTKAVVDGNTIESGEVGVRVKNTVGCSIASNTISGTGADAIRVIDSSLVSISSNSMLDNAAGNIDVSWGASGSGEDYAGISITGNTIIGAVASLVIESAAATKFDGVSVAGNTLIGLTGTSAATIIAQCSGSGTISTLSVVGNTVVNKAAAYSCLRISGVVDGVSVSGNALESTSTTTDVLLFSGTSLTNASVLGNTFRGGNYSVGETMTTITRGTVAANHMMGYNSGQISEAGGAGSIFTHAATSTTAADLPNLY